MAVGPSSLRALALALLFLISALLSTGPALSQQAPAPQQDKVAEFLKLMGDPEVRSWIEAQSQTKVEPQASTKSGLQSLEGEARSHFRATLQALPRLPAEISVAAARIRAEAQSAGMSRASVLLAIVLAAALAVEWVVRRIVSRMRRDDMQPGNISLELLTFAAFTLVAALFYLPVDWPAMTGAVLFHYLLAAIAFRFVVSLVAIARASGSLNGYMGRRVLIFTGLLFFAMATAGLAEPLAANPAVGRAILLLFSIPLLLLVLETLWRRPERPSQSVRTTALQMLYVVGLWLVWALGFRLMFWLGLYAVFLRPVLAIVDRLARAFAAARWPGETTVTIRAILTVYGIRTLFISAAVGWLALVWNYNITAIGRDNPLIAAIVAGLLKSVIVVILADFGWRVMKALIDRKLSSVASDDPLLRPDEAARRARLRTLLPIFRNALAAVLLVITILTVLAEMGVEIGPLIAGAGVFGVAVGFGSQTLVKDVISGVFYLMDDAFRIGEYIESGSYKGTVESFSLRSVRLRHHRGPVFTVPFGELGAVQNMSRDWVIDKFLLRVDFDTDMAKAKKLTKAIGAELLADPELGPEIIETLKMKGVEQISDFGIEISFAFKAKPGQQTVVRRRAYIMLRKAFAENGIGFAQPKVQVGSDDKSDAAGGAQ